MKRIFVLAIAVAVGAGLASPADAGTIAGDAVITGTPDGANFDYNVTLTNTSGAGNDPIATFWFAWVPGADFMATDPLAVTLPSGWKDVVTHAKGATPDGYAIQFDADSAATDLAPGDSLTFGFTSATTPAELAGNTPFLANTPELTSFVYSLGPLRGDGATFVVTFASVPEPSSMVLGILAVGGSLAGLRLRRRAKG